MGFLSWWKGKEAPATTAKPNTNPKPDKWSQNTDDESETQSMNGAMKVPQPADATVFEFGSVAASADKVTLAGYCPVSDELEPCRWVILQSTGTDAPMFRVVF